ncbi:hypothetical protein CY35_13G049300 [Sphagnum magellanicum]|nr:hypothetical protein CY35_13G049300 [Sphagnum magellanicum]
MAARGDEEDLLADYAVPPSRASSSYRLEPDNNGPLSGSRSSSSTSLNGRRESTNSLFSRRPSDFGSRYGFGNAYVQLDDAGIYLSSLSVTILLSALATLGIILFTLVITFAVLLGQCQKSQPEVVKSPDSCASFRLNGELNNLQGWIVPPECEHFVTQYVDSGQYLVDFAVGVDAGKQYLKPIVLEGGGLDLIVLDIDDTCLSHIPYYRDHHFGAELFNETSWDTWVYEARAPPLEPMLNFYKELQALNWNFAFITGRSENQRNFTMQNLLAAGYEGWTALILRSAEEETTPAVEYKTKERLKLEEQGYRIWSGFGDQWSDITGAASGSRTFKLPNPMYYI